MQQTKVYLALNKLEQATVRTIAKTAQIDRAEVYRAIPTLQKLGLIKKIITTPTAFKATPLSEGLSILLQQDAEKHKSIQNEAKRFLRDFKNRNEEKPSQESAQYCLAVGLKLVYREYLRELSKIQTSKDCILEWRGVMALVNRDFEYIKELLEKGAKLRYITHIPKGTKMPQNIQTLTKTGSFEIKSVSANPKAGIDIFDKKIVHIITVTNSPKEIEVLRSNNPAVVQLLQDYFELKWQSATTPIWHKNIKLKNNLKQFSRRIEHEEKEIATFIA
jgi:sugar-specific transcriptional regulator TrmB